MNDKTPNHNPVVGEEQRAFDEFETMLAVGFSELNELVTEVKRRLGPVLLPDQPEANTDCEEKMKETSRFLTLSHLTKDNFVDLNSRLTYIIERITL